MKLTPTEELIMEVLAARYRLGETLWPFDSRLSKQLDSLGAKDLIFVMDGNVEHTLRASLTEKGKKKFLSETYRSPQPVGREEFAVEERTHLDGPWDRIDTGANWSHRHGRLYTEEEARKEATAKVNGVDPKKWRRVVHRFVGPYTPLDPEQ